MNFWQGVLVFVAGIWAGGINTVVGSGTLVTFPALLAVGLSPVTANVSNTVGLFPGSLTGAYGYRRELAGQRSRAVSLSLASMLGAAVGAVLLLVSPPGAFKAVVPVLIVLALGLVIFGKRLTAWMTAHGRGSTDRVTWPLVVTTFGTGMYGGYFGAAQGVLLMGFLGLFLAESLQRLNALKNLTTGFANFVAAVVFTVASHVDWVAAGLIAAGAIGGAVIGARIGRKLPPAVLRGVIVVVGLVALVELLV